MPDEHAEPDDASLMRLIARGDSNAFEILVRRHQQAVYATAARMLGDLTEAEDVTQTVFLRVYKSAASWEPRAKFTTWLFTILRNLVFNESRRRSTHKNTSLDAGSDFISDSSPLQDRLQDAAQIPSSEALMQIELEQEIQNALNALPEQQRLAMLLLRYEELSYEEIADVLKVSVSAVKSLIFRARDALKIHLKKYLHE